MSVDPLAASYPWNSTYAFAENSVIRFIDLDGLEKLDPMPRMSYKPILGTGSYFTSAWNAVENVLLIAPSNTLVVGGRNAITNTYNAGVDVFTNPVEAFDKTVDALNPHKIVQQLAYDFTTESGRQGVITGIWEDAQNPETYETAAFDIVTGLGATKIIKPGMGVLAPGVKMFPNRPTTTQFIKNRAPKTQYGSGFRKSNISLDDGVVYDKKDGSRYTSPKLQEEAIVITMDGELRVGEGHDFLCDGARGVSFAGRGKFMGGKLVELNNQTGHFWTTTEQFENGVKMMKEIGIADENMKVVDITKP